ncbi:MAG: hypothetical protein ABSG18_21985 [Steroidobacteraceae bacterium]|jgi:hypothetical protein
MSTASDWKTIATAPADTDLELSIYDGGEFHALVFPCRHDGSGWCDVTANRPMPLEPTHWRLWEAKRVVVSVPAPLETDPVHRPADDTEFVFEAMRRELIPGITTLMLVAFGEQGIKSIEDLASCATDDLYGWVEDKLENVTKHEGILGHFRVSRSKDRLAFSCSLSMRN